MIIRHKEHVQDPYSFRCMPQVHGASKDTIDHCANIVEREINAVTDNPTVFYEEDTTPSKEALRPGAVFRAPILFVDSELRLLKIEYVDPEHKKPPMLKLGKDDENSFKHSPVLELGLRDNEELAALKCKSRPVIIFSQPHARRKVLGEKREDDSFLCLPIFGLDQYERDFVLSVRAFKYENAFYLPRHTEFRLEESFVRFDRAQIVHQHQLKRWYPHVKLHDDALMLLQEWFRYFMTGSAEDWILQYQKAELEKLELILTAQEAKVFKSLES